MGVEWNWITELQMVGLWMAVRFKHIFEDRRVKEIIVGKLLKDLLGNERPTKKSVCTNIDLSL